MKKIIQKSLLILSLIFSINASAYWQDVSKTTLTNWAEVYRGWIYVHSSYVKVGDIYYYVTMDCFNGECINLKASIMDGPKDYWAMYFERWIDDASFDIKTNKLVLNNVWGPGSESGSTGIYKNLWSTVMTCDIGKLTCHVDQVAQGQMIL